ncbi:MAG: Xaa-Pro peptidase family protein [Rhizobiaceae bacterium]|nr:Xaa-Pro peptidase family protein [Rhizobiaceae bacterium]
MVEQDFLATEFETRVENAQRAMHHEGLDALLFTSEAEMRYFTGFRTLFWQSPTRPWFLVLPLVGKPIAIIPEIGAELMRTTWIDDIRTWSSPAPRDDGISLLVEALQNSNKIGIPMGRESTLRMPLKDFEHLRQRLRNSMLVDCSDLINSQRMTKSTAEIAIISEICTIASASFANAANLFFEGQSLKAVFRSFRMDLLAQGADDVPYLVGGAGQGGYKDVISPPRDTPLRSGDVLMLDTGATRKGYYCDFDRNFAIGHAGEAAKSAYTKLHTAIDAAMRITRPGITCGELYKTIAHKLDGLEQGGAIGRFGHGLGMQLTEAPSIINFDDTVLREGMVLTLEPSIAVCDDKIMVHEENIVVQDGPPLLLSKRAPPELPVL